MDDLASSRNYSIGASAGNRIALGLHADGHLGGCGDLRDSYHRDQMAALSFHIR
jgi:hypothetical protein